MAQEVLQIGKTDWTNDELREAIPEFLALYGKKPITDNRGGMKSPHMFATWFLLKKLRPENVIESGVWKGQGTWLIENAVPNAKVFSIDLNFSNREYVSERVQYFNKDFFEIDWSFIPDKADTVLFFDDHQNAVERIRKGKELGFKQFIFEDNYPAVCGDCYSLKKAFQHAGFNPNVQQKSFLQTLKSIISSSKPTATIPPTAQDADYLKEVLDVYYEFPPVLKNDKTRWGDDWSEERYPSPEPLYGSVERDDLRIFAEEAIYYTWLCYARLK